MNITGALTPGEAKFKVAMEKKLHDGDGPAAIEDVLDSSHVQIWNFVETKHLISPGRHVMT